MKHISELKRGDLKDIRLIVLDCDGVIVPRGTVIDQNRNKTYLETKEVLPEQIEQIKTLNSLGFRIDISSGRGLYMLQNMFRPVLGFASLTYEIGSATFYRGKLTQHFNAFDYLMPIHNALEGIVNDPERDRNIKGFEPKEHIITVHAHDRVPEIEKILEGYPELYCLWNQEAYDIGVKEKQTKAVGLRGLIRSLNLERKNAIAIGDNYNDTELLAEAGISVTADRARVEGDFYIDLDSKILPGGVLMQQIISEMRK